MDRKLFILIGIFTALSANALDLKQYYASLEGKSGQELINAIMAVTKDHTVLSYSSVWANKSGADYTPQGYIWDMYSDCKFNGNDHCSGTQFTDCQCYNREHSLPKSWWGSSESEPMYTDLHHLIPTDGKANSQRAAYAFDDVKSESWSNSAGAKLGKGLHIQSTVFEVPDDYKGDIARIYFYMLCCYNNKNFTLGGSGSQCFTYTSGRAGFTTNAAKIFVLWADNDPLSDKEIKRNNTVYNRQGNRNPFVDLPDLYQYLWGNKKNQKYHVVTDIENHTEEYKYTAHVEGQTLTVNSMTEDVLSVYDMLGRVVYMNTIGVQSVQIELPQSGVYLIRVGNQALKIRTAN